MSSISSGGQSSEKKSFWNSLEVAKLFVSTVTPLVVAVVGWLIWNAQQDILGKTKDLQEQQARAFADEQKEKESLRALRLAIYREVAPLLNDILAYHFYVGRYREFSTSDIVAKKRKLDSLMFSHESLLTPAFFALYQAFMTETFKSPGYWSGESLLRTRTSCRPFNETDKANWEARFTNEDNREGVCIAYRNLLSGVAGDLLLQTVSKPPSTKAEKISMCPPMYLIESCP